MKRTRNGYERPFLDVGAVAQRYDVRRETVWTWVRQDRFPPPMRLTPGVSRWSLDDLKAWEDEKRSEVAKRAQWDETQRRKQMKQARKAEHGR